MIETKKSLFSFSDLKSCLNEPFWPKDLKINRYGLVTGNIDDFIAIKTEKNHFKIMPGPEFFPLLYRGQNKYHKKCYPSLYRNSSTEINILIERIRIIQFEILLKKHPAIKELENYKILDCVYKVDYEGLAQHYDFKTSLLDFTRSYDIADFFARCKYNKSTGEYEPLNGNCRSGVLYTIDLNIALKHMNRDQTIDIVGLQAIPRPGEQKAFSYRLAKNEDLNKKPFIQKQIIKHNKKKSEDILKRFNGGKKLFPKDDFIEDKAKEIKKTDTLSREAFEIMYCRYYKVFNKKKLRNTLKKQGISLEDTETAFTNEEISIMEQEWHKKRNAFYKKIHYRGSSPSL